MILRRFINTKLCGSGAAGFFTDPAGLAAAERTTVPKRKRTWHDVG
jgi:hypothetical protein